MKNNWAINPIKTKVVIKILDLDVSSNKGNSDL